MQYIAETKIASSLEAGDVVWMDSRWETIAEVEDYGQFIHLHTHTHDGTGCKEVRTIRNRHSFQLRMIGAVDHG